MTLKQAASSMECGLGITATQVRIRIDGRGARAFYIIVAVLVAAVAMFFGMFLPIPSNGTLHNPLWELIFGIGFGITDLLPSAIYMRAGRLLDFFGFFVWPLLMVGTVWIGAFQTLRRGGRTLVVFGALFMLSLLICVGAEKQNALAVHVPLWWNEYAVRY
jgi:hypothetical protein